MSTESVAEKLDFQNTRFLQSAATLEQCPPDEAWEVAFIGRSNAGKSSAINALTGQEKLARTSKTPGRTRLLNFFRIHGDKFLVDLPGFGYAKVPPAVKATWQRQLEAYLQERRSLKGLVLLMDCRHPFRDFDLLMIQWCARSSMPLHILLTKADKLKSGARKSALLDAEKRLGGLEANGTVQLFSALKKEGVDELRDWLRQWLGGAGSQN